MDDLDKLIADRDKKSPGFAAKALERVARDIKEAIEEIGKKMPDAAEHLRKYIKIDAKAKTVGYFPPPDGPRLKITRMTEDD